MTNLGSILYELNPAGPLNLSSCLETAGHPARTYVLTILSTGQLQIAFDGGHQVVWTSTNPPCSPSSNISCRIQAGVIYLSSNGSDYAQSNNTVMPNPSCLVLTASGHAQIAPAPANPTAAAALVANGCPNPAWDDGGFTQI
jgi:hypothetical protein